MKNFYLKLSLLFLAIMASSYLMATDYIVTGAGSDEVNGTYVESGTYYGKPQYICGEYYLRYNGHWEIGRMYWGKYYYTDNPGNTPPSSGWTGWIGSNPAPSVFEAAPNLSYSPETFQESEANDGTIENTLTITYNLPDGDYFTGDIGVFAATKYSASNIPSGLSMVITKVSNTELSAALSGTATSSNNANDISDLGIAFDNTAFNNGNASAVNNSTKSDLAVNFRDQIDVALSGGDYSTIAAAISAASSGDIINISAETFTEYGLSNGGKDLIIQGQGAEATIIQAHAPSGSAIDRVFLLSSGSITIKNLTIKNGYNQNGAGGGIHCQSSGELKIINVEISNNYTGQTGGGIFKYGGSLVIENSTIHNNTSNGSFSGGGGGIHVDGNATVTINNSTIANNSQANPYNGGAIFMDGCNVTITNSTIAGNNTGVYNGSGGNLTISNTIIAENSTNDYESSTGSLTDNGYNIVKYSNVATTSGGFDNANSILYNTKYATSGSFSSWTKGGNAVGGTLNLSSTLADNNTVNGTKTLEISSLSFAIGAGLYDASEPQDQRGASRLNPPTIGAYEYKDITQIMWDGSESSAWNTANNWSTSLVPTSSNNVSIPNDASNNPEITTGIAASCNDLTVENGATLTINPGGSLITNGTITNNGTVNIERSIIDDKWHLIASPVSNATAAMFEGNYLQYYDEGWQDITNLTTTLTPAQGYSFWSVAETTSTTFTFTGTPNTGDQSHAITGSTWNLLGNPYPSPIDWAQLDDTYGAVYYWDPVGQNNKSWNNGEGAGVQYVPAMQGFWIKPASSGTFSLSNAKRTHSGSSNYYKNKTTLPYSIELQVDAQNNYYDQLFIVLDENTSEDFDFQYDAWKLFTTSDQVPQLYSFTGTKRLSIDRRPQCDQIPLGFYCGESGQFSIKANEMTDISKLILEDTKLNIFHDLTKGAYIFDWSLTDDETRFKLHCNTTAVENISLPEMQVYVAAGNIIIKSQTTAQRIILTDITGRTLGIWESAESIPAPKTAGVYLVSIESDGQRITEKLIVE